VTTETEDLSGSLIVIGRIVMYGSTQSFWRGLEAAVIPAWHESHLASGRAAYKKTKKNHAINWVASYNRSCERQYVFGWKARTPTPSGWRRAPPRRDWNGRQKRGKNWKRKSGTKCAPAMIEIPVNVLVDLGLIYDCQHRSLPRTLIKWTKMTQPLPVAAWDHA